VSTLAQAGDLPSGCVASKSTGVIRNGWRAYRAYTAETDARHVSEVTPVLLAAAGACLLLGEWIAATIARAGGLFGVAYLRRCKRRTL
jgi:hypothetical protein